MRAVLGIISGITALALLAGCANNREPRLLPYSGSDGPDEFAIVPTKPLEAPENYAQLPAPTPGGTNRVDQTPKADAVAALGGRTATGGIDGGIVNAANKYGSDPEIRTKLADADLQFRRRHNGKLLDRIFGRNTYLDAYKRERLDSYAELERLRRAGVITPTAPPEGLQSE